MTDGRFVVESHWVRVDDRLIHGQVTVGWWQYLRYHEIWVVDEVVCGDPYLKDALRLSAPTGVGVEVIGVEDAVGLWARKETAKAVPTNGGETAEGATMIGKGAGPVLVLLRDPGVALALAEGGVSLWRVNVGNLASRAGSVRVFKNVSLTPAHVAALDALTERGIEVFFQLTPEDVRRSWQVVRRRVAR